MAEAITSLLGDGESALVSTGFVVIYAPQRNRKRFPEGCVSVHDSEAAARAAARPEQGYHPAIASGPSRSSEGLRLFYLVRWLD
jgi:hypothetical protein